MENIGGYRLVRRLGGGARAEVFLAHSVRPDRSGRTRVAAIKRFRASTSLESIDAEIEALARVSSPHLQHLDDLAHADGARPALILTRLGTVTLADLLLRRSALDAGEFVTIAAPIAEAVGELHRVGVTHGGIRVGTVLFDDDGAPALVGFGRATVIGPLPEGPSARSLTPAESAGSPGIQSDLLDLIAVIRTVAEAVDSSPERDSLLADLDRVDPVRTGGSTIDQLVDRLFAFAVPGAVDVDRDESKGAVEARDRVHAPVRHRGAAPASPPSWVASTGRVVGLPEWVQESLEHWLPRVGAITERLTRSLAHVRRPVWIVATMVALLFVGAVALIPSGPSATAGGGGGDDVTGRIETAAGRSESAPRPTEEQRAVLAGDDPVEATTVLLALRHECIVARSVTCLAVAEQAGSAIAEADSVAVRRGQESSADVAPPDTYAELVLVERLGDSAILTTTIVPPDGAEVPDGVEPPDGAEPPVGPSTTFDAATSVPVTILILRGDGVWRLRDLIVG